MAAKIGWEIVKKAMLKELLKRGDDGIMLTLPKNDILELNTRITMDRLIRNGIDPDSLTSSDQVINILENINNQRLKGAIPADSAQGQKISEMLFGKKGEVLPFKQKRSFKEEIDAMRKSGDIVDADDVKISEKITDREMFRDANKRFRGPVEGKMDIDDFGEINVETDYSASIDRPEFFDPKAKNMFGETVKIGDEFIQKERERILNTINRKKRDMVPPTHSNYKLLKKSLQDQEDALEAIKITEDLGGNENMFDFLRTKNISDYSSKPLRRSNYVKTDAEIKAEIEASNKKGIEAIKKGKLDDDPDDMATGGRAGYIHGGNVHPDGRRGFFAGAEKEAREEGKSMSPGTDAGGNFRGGDNNPPSGNNNSPPEPVVTGVKPVTVIEEELDEPFEFDQYSGKLMTKRDMLNRQNFIDYVDRFGHTSDADRLYNMYSQATGNLDRIVNSNSQSWMNEIDGKTKQIHADAGSITVPENTDLNVRWSDIEKDGETTQRQLRPSGIWENDVFIGNTAPSSLGVSTQGDYVQNLNPLLAFDAFEEKAKGGRAGYYTGGIADVEPRLDDIGHGSDSLMSRTRLVAPNSQATTSTGLNYLLAEDNDNIRVPFAGGESARYENYYIDPKTGELKKKPKLEPKAEPYFKYDIDEEGNLVPKPKIKPQPAAEGGRIGFAGGGDPRRRAFLKLMTTLGGGIAGLKSGLFGMGEGAGKKAITETVKQATGSGQPPPYFFNLVNKIKTMGEDTLPSKDKTIAKKYKDYVMEEDFAGNIEIIKKGDDLAGNKIEDVYMSYKVDEVPIKGKKGSTKVEEYEEYTARPDREGKMKDVEPGVPDEVIEEGTMFEDNITEFGKADGGRIGFQEGGGIESRLEQLGGDVTSAEKLLQELNQRLESAGSSIPEGGATVPAGSGLASLDKIHPDFKTGQPMAQLPAGGQPFMGRPALTEMPGYQGPPLQQPLEALSTPDPATHTFGVPNTHWDKMAGFGVLPSDPMSGPKYSSIEAAYNNAQDSAMEMRRTGRMDQGFLDGEMSFDDYKNNFTFDDGFVTKNKVQKELTSDPNRFPVSTYWDTYHNPESDWYQRQHESTMGIAKDRHVALPGSSQQNMQNALPGLFAQGGRAGFAGGKLATYLAGKKITGSSRRFLEKVFGKERFATMIENDPELHRGMLEVVEMFRNKDREGLKMYMQKFLPHMDDVTVEDFITGSEGTEGIQGQLIRLGSGRDYAAKIEMMKKADKMRKLDNLEVTDEMIRKPNSEGGRIGKWMGGGLGMGKGQLRLLLEFMAKNSTHGQSPANMLRMVNPKQFNKMLNDPSIAGKFSPDAPQGVAGLIKDYTKKMHSERADMLGELIGTGRKIKKVDDDIVTYKIKIVEDMVSKGVDRRTAEQMAETMAQMVGQQAGKKATPKVTEQGLLEMENLQKNLLTQDRKLQAAGGLTTMLGE